jgi:hypothetical protein
MSTAFVKVGFGRVCKEISRRKTRCVPIDGVGKSELGRRKMWDLS